MDNKKYFNKSINEMNVIDNFKIMNNEELFSSKDTSIESVRLDGDNVLVLYTLITKRGIGKNAKELLVLMFNKKQKPSLWKMINEKIKEEE